MSQVRENSNPNSDEHVSSSTTTTTSTTSNLQSSQVIQGMEISIRIPPADQQCDGEDDLMGHGSDLNSARRMSGRNSDRRNDPRRDRDRGVVGSSVGCSTDRNNDLRSGRRVGQSSDLNNDLMNDSGVGRCSDMNSDPEDHSIDPKSERGNVGRKNDRNVGHKGDPNLASNNDLDGSDPNNDDSDPPVENYIFQEEEFQFDDDDDDEDDLMMAQEETHHNLLTAQEQRQLQKRRAQSGYYRKRKKSANIDSNYVPPYAKKRFRRQTSVLPSKFLLGGNIRDPLNLASLADAKVNAALNAETPKSSPLPIPVYRHGEVPVFIPKNPDDPLGLQSNEANTPYDFIAGIRKNTKARKHRHRKKGGRRRTDSECSIDNKSEDSDTKDLKDTSVSSEEELKAGIDQNEGVKARRDSLVELGQPGEQLASGDGTSGEVPTPVDEKIIPGPSKTSKAPTSNIKAVVPQTSKQQSSGAPSSKNNQNLSASNSKQNSTSTQNLICKQQLPGPGPSKLPDQKEEIAGMSKDSKIPDASLPTTTGTKPQEANSDSGAKSSETNSPEKNGFPKKKSRQRKRPRNKPYRFLPGFFMSGQSSDYVPLGTPSVHEAHLYQYSPGGPEYFEQPYQSPSISNFASQEPGPCMEPFSPPPKPEIKRRRIVETLTETETTVKAAPEVAVAATPEVPQKKQETSKPPGNVFKPPPPPNKLHFRSNNCRKRFRHKSDPIVSPVVPQPGSRRHFNQHHFNGSRAYHKRTEPNAEVENLQNTEVSGVKYRKKDELFQYGNYNRYYGYRISDEGIDLRLSAFPKEMFANKDVLDVGCNIGHVTMLIARDNGAKSVLGIDIDPKLIEVAKKNVKHYVDRDPSDETIRFPHSCPLMYGVLQPPPGTVGDTRKIPFPYNVSFRQENYVLESDDLLEGVKPEYDLVLCLSITKWIHLNYGDDGLKRFFRRAFLNLRPGGKLIVEPQPWSSYKRKKKLTEQIFANFKAIRFYPDKFQDFLLKEVGFSSMEKLTTPTHSAKGFQRPLMVFTKADKTDSTPRRSPTHPQLGLVEMITTGTAVPANSPAFSVSSTPPTPSVTSSVASDQPPSPHLDKHSPDVKDSGDVQ